MNIKDQLSEIGINAIAAAAGLIGGIIHVTMDDKQFSFKGAFAQMASAVALSGYGTEWLAKWLRLEDKASTCGLIGLCLGMCGIYVAKGIIKLGKKFENNPVKFIKNKGGNDDVAND